jgi:hypothetical protein
MAPYKDVVFDAYGRPILIASLRAVPQCLWRRAAPTAEVSVEGYAAKAFTPRPAVSDWAIELPVFYERFPGAQQSEGTDFGIGANALE